MNKYGILIFPSMLLSSVLGHWCLKLWSYLTNFESTKLESYQLVARQPNKGSYHHLLARQIGACRAARPDSLSTDLIIGTIAAVACGPKFFVLSLSKIQNSSQGRTCTERSTSSPSCVVWNEAEDEWLVFRSSSSLKRAKDELGFVRAVCGASMS